MLDRRFKGLIQKVCRGDCVLVLGPRLAVPRNSAGSHGPASNVPGSHGPASNVPGSHGPASNGPASGEVALEDYVVERVLAELGIPPAPPAQHLSVRSAIGMYERARGTSACRSLVQEWLSELDQATTEVHQNLARLPFKLVLSAAPDRMMFNAIVASGKTGAREACYNYCYGIAAQSELSLPSSEEPIVYSLFGRHDHPESMVLNEKNLLDYLVRMVKEAPALPDAVRATLRAPSTVFLFIGFGLSNWWLRLILKVLEVIGVENRALSLALEDEGVGGAMSEENRAFFESVGIYVQTGDDWRSFAKELANTFDSLDSGTISKPPALPNPGGPLVFLSYASEDAERVDGLRAALQKGGVKVWVDKQNLRAGQNWKAQIQRVIEAVQYFVFVQSANMDQRDRERRNGVYNWELTEAIARQKMLSPEAVFIIHATLGACRERPEPELAKLHRNAVDSAAGVDKLIRDIMSDHLERPLPSAAARQAS